MLISDYHMHSNFSPDSKEKLENIVKRAKELGLKEIAITDHLDLKKSYESEREFSLDLNVYIKTLQELKEKNKKDLDIKVGLEFGIQKHLCREGNELLKKYPFDFIISSVHSIDNQFIDLLDIWEGKTRDEMHLKYFLEVLECVKNFSNYSVHGHLDFITRYGGVDKKGKMNYKNYQEIIDEIFKILISNGKGIEINTSGIRYTENRFYPCDDLVKRYFELGGEIVTIGSDSHKAEDLGKDFKRAYEFLESIGVKYISSFNQMNVDFIKIK